MTTPILTEQDYLIGDIQIIDFQPLFLRVGRTSSRQVFNELKMTWLLHAIQDGNLPIVEFLHYHDGSDIFIQQNHHAITCCISYQQLHIAQYIFTHTKLKWWEETGLFHETAKYGSIPILDLLLHSFPMIQHPKDSFGISEIILSSLDIAARHNHQSFVAYCLNLHSEVLQQHIVYALIQKLTQQPISNPCISWILATHEYSVLLSTVDERDNSDQKRL